MTQEKLRKLHLIYGIVLACIVIVTGICFIGACVHIYTSGSRPFTRESISTHFISIIIPVILCLLGVIGGIVLSFFPLEKPKLNPFIDTGVVLNRLSKRVDVEKCDEDTRDKIKRERRLRFLSKLFCVDAVIVCIVISLIYGLNKNNFPATNINSEMVDAMIFMLPCLIVGLGAIYALILIRNASIARELALLKQAMKNGNKQSSVEGEQNTVKAQPNEKILLGVRASLLILAITFIIIGMFNGGMTDVLQKAINICTECIGLG